MFLTKGYTVLKKLSIILSLTLFILTACNVPGLSMPDDGPPVAVSEDAAQSLEQKVIQAAATTGQSTVSTTQEEVTSYFALRLDALAAQNGVENPWQEPQVYFKENGQIVLRGNIEYEGYMQPIRLVAEPSAVAGSLQVNIVEGRIGPVPVPDSILSQAEEQLGQAILAGQQYASLDEVRVEAGTLALTGSRK